MFGFGVHRTRRKDTKINNEQKQLGQDEKHSPKFGNVFRGLFINFLSWLLKKYIFYEWRIQVTNFKKYKF